MVETLETRNEITAQALAEETAKGLTDEGKRRVSPAGYAFPSSPAWSYMTGSPSPNPAPPSVE
jgi:hypothetical protein